MSLDNIHQWIKEQPRWAQDALRRLSEGNLSDDDKGSIINNLKNKNEINTSKKSECLDFADVGFKESTNSKITLCAIGPLKGVNRLADDQKMEFAIEGITLIYGDNGSGKSGYCRIAKALCRAVAKDRILGNVFVDTAKTPAKINIRYKIDDEEPIEESWSDGEPTPEPMSGISVFDASCARFYVDKENKIEYLPFEIELLEKYANLLQEIKIPFDKEIQDTREKISTPSLASYREDTTISKKLALIEESTSMDDLSSETEIRALAVFTSEDANKIKALEAELAQDPTAKRANHESLTNLVKQIEKIEDIVLDEELENLKKAYLAVKAEADRIENIVKELQGDPLSKLSNVGNDPWKLMFKYAVEYAKSIDANTDHVPDVKDKLCVLCQQPLGQEASDRIKKFNEFIKNKAVEDLESTKNTLKNKLKAINETNIPKIDEYQNMLEQYSRYNKDREDFSNEIRAFLNNADQILAELKQLTHESDFRKPSISSDRISERIISDLSVMKGEIESLEGEGEEKFKELQFRLYELKDKKQLSQEIEPIVQRIKDIIFLKKLQDCLSQLSTQAVSRKITELRKKLLNEEFQRDIDREIKALDLSLPVQINDKTDRGSTFIGVNLKSKQSVSNSDVLSEGEQKALALSCFLAEVKRDPTQNGIIIDDPVSSLDHHRIRKVADRLVSEAKKRQVIIFTHSILFYNEVERFAAEYQISLKGHYIYRSNEKGFGVIGDGESQKWPMANVGKRISRLQKLLSEIQDKQYDTEDIRRSDVKDFYTDLRETWERLVEEVLLNKVIQRYDSNVKTQSLKSVSVSDEDFTTIYHAIKRVSEYSGHDQAQANNTPLPKNDDIGKDLERIIEFRDELKERKNKTEASRKQLLHPHKAQTI